jgi:dihydropteroate synthase
MDEIHAKLRRRQGEWKLRSRRVPVGSRTLIMGIVNVTPDSFSDGGKYCVPEKAVAHSLQLLDEGADILDLGAESTRPGSLAGSENALSAEEEQARLLPVLTALLRERPEAVVSVDTYRASTARMAIEAGAEIVNDVSGFLWDTEMARVCAESRCGVILMHTRGLPSEWKDMSALAQGSVLPLVRDGLAARVEAALAAGIAPESLAVDPGYGFGKRLEENFDLMAHQRELLALGYPLLVGVSRKGFLTKALAGRVELGDAASEAASIAGMVAAILGGASIVRVHQVRGAVAAATVADAVLAQKTKQRRPEA